MEPIVLLGLICVVYGGYVAATDWLGGSEAAVRRAVRTVGQRKGLKPPVKKMAGVHV